VNLGIGLALVGRGGEFSPSNLALTGWWQAGSYVVGTWTGTASAGASGGRNGAGIGANPALGTAINGYQPPDFDGALSGSVLALGVAISSFIASGGWTLGVLLNCDTASTTDPVIANNQLLFGDGQGFWGLYASNTSGSPKLHLLTNDGTEKAATVALSTGAWVYAHCTYNGTTMTVDLGGGTTANAASGAPSNMTNGLRFGRRLTNTSFDGRIAEIMVGASNALWSRSQAVGYLNSRYGLALP